MKVGYARVSTVDQVAGFQAQIRDLEAVGCEKIFQEQLSSVADRRPQLDAMIDYIREGDEITVTRLDRLARSVADMVDIVKRIRAKKAVIVLPGIGAIDGNDPTSDLLFNVLTSIAQFERQIMLARQREGIAKAKAEGRYRGRKPTAQAKADQVRAAAAEGHTRAEIARDLGVSERSVYRILADTAPTAG
jgi:DNA invertase Pin-like site-specific DNA recombinase